MPEDAGSEACIRCRDRSTECEFAVAAQRRGESSGSDVGGATRAAGKPSEPHGNATSLALARGSSRSINLEITEFPHGAPNSPVSLEWSMESIWDTSLRDLEVFGFNTPLFVELGIDPLVVPWGEETCTVESGISALKPWDISGPSLFERRTFSKPNQVPLVSLAMQILRSFPFMILRKAALPPFINPLQISWAKTGEGPRQQVS